MQFRDFPGDHSAHLAAPATADGLSLPRRRVIMAAALVSTASFATSPGAQSYPGRPIRLMIPFTSGGGCDATARLIAEQLGRKLGKPIIAENRPGASGAVAATAVAQGPSDGYTLLVGSATLAGNAVVTGPRAGVDVVGDFELVGTIGQTDLMVMTPAKLQIKDLRGLVNLMRDQPATVQYGSPGIGSISHLGAELLKLVTKTDAMHVPYKGESAALPDLISGHLTFQLCAPHICVPRVLDGTLKALAIASRNRTWLAPSVPTAAQAGVYGVEVGTWWYLAAPKGTPATVIAKLNSALNQVLAEEKFRGRLLAMGIEARPGTTPASVEVALRREMRHWHPIAKVAGITTS